MATISPNINGKAGRVIPVSEEANNAALMRELRTGEKFRRALNERKREQQAAAEAQRLRGHRTLNAGGVGLGKCVLSIPQQEFFTVQEKVGGKTDPWQCWHDKEFIQYCQRKFPHLAPNKT